MRDNKQSMILECKACSSLGEIPENWPRRRRYLCPNCGAILLDGVRRGNARSLRWFLGFMITFCFPLLAQMYCDWESRGEKTKKEIDHHKMDNLNAVQPSTYEHLDPIVGRIKLSNGTIRLVHQNRDGRQYIFDHVTLERKYGNWVPERTP